MGCLEGERREYFVGMFRGSREIGSFYFAIKLKIKKMRVLFYVNMVCLN